MSEPYAPEETPGTLNHGQRVRIMLGLAERGIKSHDDRVAELSNMTGRKIESTNDLSYREAASVILTLGRAVRS
jgi:hypothetical protein